MVVVHIGRPVTVGAGERVRQRAVSGVGGIRCGCCRGVDGGVAIVVVVVANCLSSLIRMLNNKI